MTRSRPKKTLSHAPLALALAQVRFSPLMLMGDYIAKIQDRFRQSGYPINGSMQVQEFLLGSTLNKAVVRPHWEFLSKDRTTSVVVNEGFVVVQTTMYDDFEAFLKAVADATEVVSSVVGALLIQRIGLRYVDLIRPREGESWEKYIQPGLCGFASNHFIADTALRLHQTVTGTPQGTMFVRLLQNRERAILPPDLASQSLLFPRVSPPAPDELLTVVDIDHFHESEPDDFERSRLERIAWELKNTSYEVFTDSIVTDHALEVWA